MLSKYVKGKFYVMKLGVSNVELLIQGNYQGERSGSTSMGR